MSCSEIDLNVKNKEGFTPKDLALKTNNEKLKDYFNPQKRKHLGI